MRYYDPLLRIVIENLSDHNKDFIDANNNVAYTIHNDLDLKKKILERLGFTGDGKLYYKFNSINKKAPHEINLHQSTHTLAL